MPSKLTAQEDLERIRAERKRLDAEERAIYAASVKEGDPSLKVADDRIAAMLAEEPLLGPLTPPFEVHGVSWWGSQVIPWEPSERNPFPWVAIRPVAEEYGGRTLFGVRIGDIATSVQLSLTADGVLRVGPCHNNPAIFVPDLYRVIFGFESWWGSIKSPDKLREITDSDIGQIWYVRAMRDLFGANA